MTTKQISHYDLFILLKIYNLLILKEKINWHKFSNSEKHIYKEVFHMYSHLLLTGQLPNVASARRSHKLLVAGNWAMIIGLAITLLSVLASFILADWFSISTQVVAHISTLLFVTLIKFGYVMRLQALHQLDDLPKGGNRA